MMPEIDLQDAVMLAIVLSLGCIWFIGLLSPKLKKLRNLREVKERWQRKMISR